MVRKSTNIQCTVPVLLSLASATTKSHMKFILVQTFWFIHFSFQRTASSSLIFSNNPPLPPQQLWSTDILLEFIRSAPCYSIYCQPSGLLMSCWKTYFMNSPSLVLLPSGKCNLLYFVKWCEFVCHVVSIDVFLQMFYEFISPQSNLIYCFIFDFI